MTKPSPTKPTLADLTKQLVDIRELITKQDTIYNETVMPLKEEKEAIVQAIMMVMKDQGIFSTRFSDLTVSLTVRRTPKVINEQLTIAWLEEKGLANEYIRLRPNDTFYANLPSLIKDESIAGVEILETEFVSLRKTDESKDKRRIIN